MKNNFRFIFPAFILLCISLSNRNVAVGFDPGIMATDKPPLSTHGALQPGPGELYDFAHVDTNAIKNASVAAEKNVNEILEKIFAVADGKRSFENTMLPLDEVYNVLQKATSVDELMMETSTDKNIRDLSGAMLGKFTSETDELLQNEKLYKAVNDFAVTDEANKLTGERFHFVDRILKEFQLNGMMLKKTDRDTLISINNRLNDLGVAFGKNIASDTTKVRFEGEFLYMEELAGLPDNFLKNFCVYAAPDDHNNPPMKIYSFDLSTPTYNEFMTECTNTESRKKMYLAKMNVGGGANEKLLVTIIKLRTQKAQLLGFKTYSEYSTSDIMSKNTETVWKFEKGLAADLRPKAQADLDVMLAMKTKMTGTAASSIFPYENLFYANEVLKSKYNVDPEKVKEYFEMNNVIGGIFQVYQKLYNISFVEDKSPSVWNSDVKAYTVFDNAKKTRIGYFYLDLYPRENKYNHFGCFSITGSKTYPDGTSQLHSAALVCNFPPSTKDHPSLLPHSQVVTFFHEFGHLIHNMLSETELSYDAGTNVATDFVEAPSQIMENWAWQKNVLSLFAKHYKNRNVIPDSLLNNMIAARNLNSGLLTLQQVFYGTLDFTFNDGFAPASSADIVAKTKELQNSITFYPWVEGTHFAGTFGHLTGYGSRYYGYLWSLVYAADMFSEFEKTSPLDPETGKRYREKVLAKGGSDDAINLVTDFLGREPNNKAFLHLIGLNSK
ncbi:MAG: Zn-dependent oligopeptidase [Bacteroidetes bacterium]|nr:Zn-dependent oligopeptidase [Bacteroidota bacterium]